MKVNHDFRDLFAALNDAGAEYLLVGGYAFAYHASPRFTKDLDVWVRPSKQNAALVFKALDAFGAPLHALTEADLATEGIVFQMGVPPSRIDVLTAIDGVDFDDAWSAKIESEYGDQKLHVISREHLLQNKKASGRPQDLLDVKALESDSSNNAEQ